MADMDENPYKTPAEPSNGEPIAARESDGLQRVSAVIAIVSFVLLLACTGICLFVLPNAKAIPSRPQRQLPPRGEGSVAR